MKKLLAVIFSLAILSGCFADRNKEIGSTSGTSDIVTTAKSTETTTSASETTTIAATVTTAETAAEVTTEAIDTSGIEYIKEAMQANWGVEEHNDSKGEKIKEMYPSVFFADLNADGVDELFETYNVGSYGIVSVYDVSDGARLLCEMRSRTYPFAGAFYTDPNGALHYIIRSDYSYGSVSFHTAYFDLTYTENGVSLTVPFCALPDTWYDGPEFKSEYAVYTDCGYDISDFYAGRSYGFKKISEDNYVGNYSIHDISYDDNGETDSAEIKEIIQKSVFDGLTYICDAEPFFAEPKYADFDEFWSSVSVKIAEVYGDEAAGTSEIDYINGFAFIGQKNEAAIYHVRGEGFFKDENGEVTPLNNEIPYEWIYKVYDDVIVCQPLGTTQPCDVYIMVDGKPVLDEKISRQGHAMKLNVSKLYDGGFEITESIYDAYFLGSHTFKTYQLYRDEDGFHEYGSIVVPVEDFNKYYGDAAQVFVDDIAEKWGVNGISVDIEIDEVLYRSDNSFILNCRSPLIAGDNDDICGYKYYNITLKPTANGRLTEVYRGRGLYRTALIPEIAVYPEKMYVPEK